MKKTIKAVKHPKGIEADYFRAIYNMRTDILKAFNATVDLKEFTDSKESQIAKFSASAEKITKRSGAIASVYTEKLYKYYLREFYKKSSISSGLINLKALEKSDKETFDILKSNATEYINKYGDDVATWIKTNVRQNYIEGGTYKNLIEEIKERANVDENKAKLIARSETGTFIGSMNLKRAKDLGIKKGIWRTMKDERVRESHARADGKEFLISEGLEVDGEKTFPGLPIRCRCYMEYVIE